MLILNVLYAIIKTLIIASEKGLNYGWNNN